PETMRAVNWLLKEQNSDGGWGEKWSGESSRSTCEHTGLALYGLCLASAPDAYSTQVIQAIQAGVRWLTEHQRSNGTWESVYFMNFGFGLGCANAQLTMVWAL